MLSTMDNNLKYSTFKMDRNYKHTIMNIDKKKKKCLKLKFTETKGN